MAAIVRWFKYPDYVVLQYKEACGRDDITRERLSRFFSETFPEIREQLERHTSIIINPMLEVTELTAPIIQRSIEHTCEAFDNLLSVAFRTSLLSKEELLRCADLNRQIKKTLTPFLQKKAHAETVQSTIATLIKAHEFPAKPPRALEDLFEAWEKDTCTITTQGEITTVTDGKSSLIFHKDPEIERRSQEIHKTIPSEIGISSPSFVATEGKRPFTFYDSRLVIPYIVFSRFSPESKKSTQDIMVQLLYSIAVCHKHGYAIHDTLENIIHFCPDEKHCKPEITCFGHMKPLEATLPKDPTSVIPEVAFDEEHTVSEKQDVFLIGYYLFSHSYMFYYMDYPYDPMNSEERYRIYEAFLQPTLTDHCEDKEFALFLGRMLSKNPDDRPTLKEVYAYFASDKYGRHNDYVPFPEKPFADHAAAGGGGEG